MKQTYKNYLFSNFKTEYSTQNLQKNELTLDKFYNIKFDKGVIKSASDFRDYFINKFDNLTEYNLFFNKNEEILRKIIYLAVYNFNNEETKIKDERYFLICEDLSLYEINFSDYLITDLNIKFDTFPTVFYKDGYLYFYDNSGVYICDCDNEIQFYSDVLKPKCYAEQDDNFYFIIEDFVTVVFISEKTKLINLNPNIDIYDKIELDYKNGKILKLIVMKNKLYIFQQYKISVYDVYASRNQIISECELTSKIINNTIFCINDYIVFLTTNGLMLFDGNNLELAFNDICADVNFNYEKMFSFVFNEKYYLSAEIKYNDSYKLGLFSFDFEREDLICYVLDKTINDYEIIKTDNEYSLILFCENDLGKSVLIQTSDPSQSLKTISFNKIYFDTSDNKQIN